MAFFFNKIATLFGPSAPEIRDPFLAEKRCPDEIKQLVFSCLSRFDLVQCSKVCRDWHRVITANEGLKLRINKGWAIKVIRTIPDEFDRANLFFAAARLELSQDPFHIKALLDEAQELLALSDMISYLRIGPYPQLNQLKKNVEELKQQISPAGKREEAERALKHEAENKAYHQEHADDYAVIEEIKWNALTNLPLAKEKLGFIQKPEWQKTACLEIIKIEARTNLPQARMTAESDEQNRDYYLSHLVDFVGAEQPDSAADIAQSIKDPTKKIGALMTAAKLSPPQLKASLIASAKQTAATISDKFTRGLNLFNIVCVEAPFNLQAAKATVKSIQDPYCNAMARVEIVKVEALTNRAEAERIARSIPVRESAAYVAALFAISQTPMVKQNPKQIAP